MRVSVEGGRMIIVVLIWVSIVVTLLLICCIGGRVVSQTTSGILVKSCDSLHARDESPTTIVSELMLVVAVNYALCGIMFCVFSCSLQIVSSLSSFLCEALKLAPKVVGFVFCLGFLCFGRLRRCDSQACNRSISNPNLNSDSNLGGLIDCLHFTGRVGSAQDSSGVYLDGESRDN